MLKANVCYSKKVPVDGMDFSSQGYSLTLETEVPETDPQGIQTRLHETFELVKATVENELANGNGKASQPAEPATPLRGNRNASSGKASNKQIKFLTDLATQQGISIADLNARIRQEFRVDGIYELSRRNASVLLDELNKGTRRQAA